jgi:hypothetical protein
MKHHARKAQAAAMEHPVASNEETEELLAWFESELVLRERDRKPKASAAAVIADQAAHKNGKGKGEQR